MFQRDRTLPSSSQPRLRLLVYLLALLLLPVSAKAQTTIAEWAFATQVLTPSTAIPANANSLLGTSSGLNSILLTTVGGPNGNYASVNGWAGGANSKYWVIAISTAGYGTLTLSSDQWSEYQFFSSQGPRDYKVQYSLDSSSWTDVPNSAVAMTAIDQGMKKGSLSNVALPAACENQSVLYLRWIMTSNTGAEGTYSVSNGQNWVDNISIKGTAGSSNTAPTISAISNQSTLEDMPLGPIGFTVGDAQSAPSTLTISAASSNTSLVPNTNLALGGSGASRTITVTPSPNAFGATTITIIVSDGSLSVSETFDVNVTSVNDAPILTGIEASAASFVEDGMPLTVTSSVTATDVDNTNLSGATVSISSGYVSGEDFLLFTNTASITGSYSNGVLTLTGSDSKANYETALRGVRYQNTNGVLPNTTSRTISFTVSDGVNASNTVMRSITVTEVNDAPTAAAGADQTISCVLPAGIPVNVDGSASADIENDILSYAWTMNGNPFAATAAASINLAPGVHTLVLTVNDGRGGIDRDTLVVTLIPDTTPPTVTAPPNRVFTTDPGTCTFTNTGGAVGMATASDNCPGTVMVSSNAPTVFPKGLTIVQWSGMDASGNTAIALQTITVIDTEAPAISSCPSPVSVEGNVANQAQLPDLRWQVITTDNCTPLALLAVVQTPAPGTVLGAGTHPITFTVTDESGNPASCNSTYSVVPRVEIDPEAALAVVSTSCKQPVTTTRAITINNSGGSFGGGKLQWSAGTGASEITIVTGSGFEGDDLVFTVSNNGQLTGTINRTISIAGWNSVTGNPASNTPYSITVQLRIEPLGTVTVVQAVGTTWTPFYNANGQKIAEVKSNAAAIPSLTVSMYPCTSPPGLARIRYVNRYYTLSGAVNPNIDVRFYYSTTEALGLITQPSALTVWQRPSYTWTNRGGSSHPFENMVQVNGLTNLAGPFALAHGWIPKEEQTDGMPVATSVSLEQNYPNPFNPTTTITYSLAAAAYARISVLDLYGREISRLADGSHDAGSHRVIFDAGALPAGVYTVVLASGSTLLSRQMQLVK